MNCADAGAGMNRRQHVERADEADVGVTRQQHAHGIGIAGDMDVLDFEVAHPALLLRHEIRQRKRRHWPGKDHLDLGGVRGRSVKNEEYRGEAKDYCTQSKRNHDNSPRGRTAITRLEK
jgi:hypothetical protein